MSEISEDRMVELICEAYAAIGAHRAMGVGEDSIERFVTERFGDRIMDAVLAKVDSPPLTDEFKEKVLSHRKRIAQAMFHSWWRRRN